MVHVERVDRLNVSLFLLFQFSYEHVSKMRLFGLCACVRTCTRVCMRARRVCVCVCSGKQTGWEGKWRGTSVSFYLQKTTNNCLPHFRRLSVSALSRVTGWVKHGFIRGSTKPPSRLHQDGTYSSSFENDGNWSLFSVFHTRVFFQFSFLVLFQTQLSISGGDVPSGQNDIRAVT